MAVKCCNETVHDICFYVQKLLDVNPKAANTEVLQRLKARMHRLLRQKRFRDVEEVGYEILLKLELLRTEKNDDKEVAS